MQQDSLESCLAFLGCAECLLLLSSWEGELLLGCEGFSLWWFLLFLILGGLPRAQALGPSASVVAVHRP